ncbi:hypothetical protein SAMN05216414_1461, partial [Nitrosovibrio sp. Nv17]
AYTQVDVMTGRELAVFPLWQLFHARFDPDNFDDLGSLGRPFLDAARKTWCKLDMTEEDLVIRRRVPSTYPAPSLSQITELFKQLRSNPGKLVLAEAF